MATAVTGSAKSVKNKPTVKMPGDTKLVESVMEQGPKDSQAAVDGYAKHIGPLQTQYNSTLNKYADDLYSSYSSLFESLGLGKLNLGSLQGLSKINQIVKELDPDKLIKRIEDGLLGGRSLQSIMELPARFKQDALGTLADLTRGTVIGGLDIGKLVRTGAMTYEEGMRAYKVIKNGDWSSLSGIAKSLEALGATGLGQLAKGIIDVQAVGALLGQIVKTAAELGDHELVKEVAKLFKSSRHRNGALNAVVYNAALNSDLQTLDSVIKVLGGMEVARNNPKAIRYILSSYKLDPLYTVSESKNYRRRLITLLSELDPNWCYDYINNKKVTKLEPFGYMSDDCKKIFKYFDTDEEDWLNEILLATSYKETDAKQLTMSFFKDITFRNRPLDPREKP